MSGYPNEWPRCECGKPVMDGHLTCGEAACSESDARDRKPAGFKLVRTEGFFKPHDGPAVSLGEIKIDRVTAKTEYIDPDTGAIVRTETRVNGVLQPEDGA